MREESDSYAAYMLAHSVSPPTAGRCTARSTDATVLDVTQFPGGIKGTEGGYIQLIDYLVNSLAKALKK